MAGLEASYLDVNVTIFPFCLEAMFYILIFEYNELF